MGQKRNNIIIARRILNMGYITFIGIVMLLDCVNKWIDNQIDKYINK
jgi:hypothetical protein